MKNLEPSYNFREVATRTLYRSGQPDQRFLHFLKERYRIKSIVNLRSAVDGFEEKFALDNRIYLLHLPLKPFSKNPTEEDILAFLRIFSDPGKCPALVHCQEGKNRTGIMVAFFRMLRQDWTTKMVVSEMRSNETSVYWRLFLRLNGRKLKRIGARL